SGYDRSMPGIHIPPQSGLRISGPLSCNGITIYSAVITVTSLFTATVKWLACYRIATIYQKIPGNYPENVRVLGTSSLATNCLELFRSKACFRAQDRAGGGGGRSRFGVLGLPLTSLITGACTPP